MSSEHWLVCCGNMRGVFYGTTAPPTGRIVSGRAEPAVSPATPSLSLVPPVSPGQRDVLLWWDSLCLLLFQPCTQTQWAKASQKTVSAHFFQSLSIFFFLFFFVKTLTYLDFYLYHIRVFGWTSFSFLIFFFNHILGNIFCFCFLMRQSPGLWGKGGSLSVVMVLPFMSN